MEKETPKLSFLLQCSVPLCPFIAYLQVRKAAISDEIGRDTDSITITSAGELARI